MVETLQLISLISYIAGGVMLALAVFLWFYFGIPTVIGDLTGRTARRSIARLRASNEKGGAKSYRTSKGNQARGKLTETIPERRTGPQAAPKVDSTRPDTGLLQENRAGRDVALSDATAPLSEETAPLTEETAPLTEETAPLNEETAPLTEETAMLGAAPAIRSGGAQTSRRSGGVAMRMLDEVMLIHTRETID